MESGEHGAAQQAGKSNGKKSRGFVIILIALGALGAFYVGRWFVFRLTYVSTDDAQVDADLIPVSSKVPGRVARILVSTGDRVAPGQVIAEIESTDYELALNLGEAKLEAAKLDLEKARSALALTRSKTETGVLQSSRSLDQVKGQVTISETRRGLSGEKLKKDVERAKVNLERIGKRVSEAEAVAGQAKEDLRRAEELYAAGVVSKEKTDLAGTAAEVAESRMAQVRQEKLDAEKAVELAESNLRQGGIDATQEDIARKDRDKAGYALALSRDQKDEEVRMAEATVKQLEAQVRAMETAAEQAATALRETKILSPVEGIVARKISLPAEIVPAGKPICFVLDTGSVWVNANIEETKLESIHEGSKAAVTVDALPGKTFKGLVKTVGAAANSKFSLIPAGNTSGQFIKVTQRIPVKIYLEGDTAGMKPGMNAVVTIKKKQGGE